MITHKISLRRDSVAYGAGILLGSSLALNLLGLCYRMVLARDLGPEGLAVYQLTIAIYSILAGISTAGITSAVSQGAAILTGSGRSKELSSLLHHGLFAFFILYTVLLVIVLPLSPALAQILLGNSSRCSLIALLFPYMLLTGVENIHKSLFLGLGRTMVPSVSEVVEQIIRIILLPLVVRLTGAYTPDAKAASLLFTMFLGEVFAASFMIICYLRCKSSMESPISPAPKCGPTAGRLLLSIGLPTATTGLGIRLISSACSILMPQCLLLSGMAPDEATRTYGTFTGMTMPLMTMCTALTGPLFTAVMPKVSKAIASGNMVACRRKCGKVLHVTSLVAIPSMAVLMVCAEDLSMLMFGDSYPGTLCRMFIPCITLSFYGNAAIFLLSAMGHNGLSGGIALLSGILQLINLWLGPVGLSAGLLGYAVLETLNDSLVAGLGIWLVHHHSGLRIMWKNWFVSPLVAAVPSYLASNLLYARLSGWPLCPLWMRVLGPCVVLLGVYCLWLIIVAGLRPKQYIMSMLDISGT